MDAFIHSKERQMKYITLENRIRSVIRESRKRLHEAKKPPIEKDQADQIAAGTYVTKHFEMCPGSQKLFTSLPKGVDPMKAERLAILHDQLFALEKHAKAQERTTQSDVDEAGKLADRIRTLADEMGIAERVGYIKDHLDLFNKYLQPDTNIVDRVTPEQMRRLFTPPTTSTPEPMDNDIDNSKFVLSRNIKAQRKLKIIDVD